MGHSDNRPLKAVLISGVDIMLLPDSGATVNAMDEATFKKYSLDERVKIKKSRCQIKPFGAEDKNGGDYEAANKRRHPHRTIARV